MTSNAIIRYLAPTAMLCAATIALAQADGGAGPAPCLLEQGVDRQTTPSDVCMKCHDAVRGSFEHGGHKVEVGYDPYGKDLYSKPEERGVNVVLPGGRITCLSCHDPRSRLPMHLAATTAGPVSKRLCVACHLFE